MNKIQLKAYAKINIALDVIRKMHNGYHQVDMVMQNVSLYDDVMVRWLPKTKETSVIKINDVEIEMGINKYFIPKDKRNLAVKAAILMCEEFGENQEGKIRIDIKKQIPVAAGMAGGSSNGAAVLLAINELWNLELSLKKICEIGEKLGADVPFEVMGIAKLNKSLSEYIYNDSLASTTARAEGTGVDITPIQGAKYRILLSKPNLSVSTPEVYKGLKLNEIINHPNIDNIIEGLKYGNFHRVKMESMNLLETYTLEAYKIVLETKEKMLELLPEALVLMSGSGPTVFALISNNESQENVDKAYEVMKKINKETFIAETLL